tara:strand:- start:4896 stop:5144 length:249 start_codon:yes stop_codon:yes gene_type:complete
MCLICVDLQKDKLTWKEARRNLNETHDELDKEHILEVLRLIWKKEDEEKQPLHLDKSLSKVDYDARKQYEEIVELWKTYGGD